MCTCRAVRLPWRSFLGRSAAALHLDSTCREIFWDAVASLVGFGAPNNYFASFSVGRTDCICLVEFFASAQLPNSPCVFSWDAVASLFIMTRLTTTSAAFPLAKQIFLARLTEHIAILVSCIPSRNKAEIVATSSPVLSILLSCSLSWCTGAAVLGMNSAGWSHGPPMKTLSVLHHMHGAQLPHLSPVR